MAVRTLSPQLEKVSQEELNEDPNRREQDLTHMRDWLCKQPHLPHRTDRQWLITFLRGCKFSLERTKSKLDMYFTMRTALPEFFSNRDPLLPELQHLLKQGVCVPLYDPEGRVPGVMLLRIGMYDTAQVKIADLFKMTFMVNDILLEENDNAVINGQSGLLDLKNATLGHAAQLGPAVVKKAMTAAQEAYPLRQQGMHYIHTPNGYETVFNLFKSFMKEKTKKRLYVHGDNMEALHGHIPKRILPEEYGGYAGPVNKLAEDWRKKVESYRSWFLENEKLKSNEKKRPGKPKTQEDLFGLEGSFRQLNVD